MHLEASSSQLFALGLLVASTVAVAQRCSSYTTNQKNKVLKARIKMETPRPFIANTFLNLSGKHDSVKIAGD